MLLPLPVRPGYVAGFGKTRKKLGFPESQRGGVLDAGTASAILQCLASAILDPPVHSSVSGVTLEQAGSGVVVRTKRLDGVALAQN
jgi:hypothetical protein